MTVPDVPPELPWFVQVLAGAVLLLGVLELFGPRRRK